MANPSAPGAACYEVESSWGENVSTFATYRVPIRGAVDCSGLFHNSVPSERVEQYRQGGSPHVKMTMGGTFKTLVDWRGHGTTTAGSPTVDALETLKGIVFGVAPALSAAASTTLTGGTAAVPTTTASGTFSAGSLCRVGSLGDARGNGQFYAIGTHVTTTLTLIGALGATPTNGDVLYPVVQTYPASSTAAVTSTRWLFQGLDEQYECHGCYPMSVSITGLNPGERPQLEITWGVSWWALSSATFPSAVTSDSLNPAPVAAGSLNVQVVGTTTRNVRTTARELTVDYSLNVMPLKGYGGVNAYQDTVGAVRGSDEISISWLEDAEPTTTTPVVPSYWDSGSSYHIEWTGATTAGSAIGFKAPKFCPSDEKPVQIAVNGRNCFRLKGKAYTGGTTTTALTLAAIVFGDA